jgi:hypothetical protein
MSFTSTITPGACTWMPDFSGIRVMMMPFHVADPIHTLPPKLREYAELVEYITTADGWKAPAGVGYLTVDEAELRAGETHRRPGLHVDGVGEDGSVGTGAWGGGGGYAAHGMVLMSNVLGCVGWAGDFEGEPGRDGDCTHLAPQCFAKPAVFFEPLRAYWCGPLAVHQAVPVQRDCRRQFVRVSMPSKAPWHQGYTANPLGIKPAGPVLPARPGMAYRRSGS